MATVVLSLRHWAGGEPIDLGYRAAYSALSKPAWGLALAWIIIVRAWRPGPSHSTHYVSVVLLRLRRTDKLVHVVEHMDTARSTLLLLLPNPPDDSHLLQWSTASRLPLLQLAANGKSVYHLRLPSITFRSYCSRCPWSPSRISLRYSGPVDWNSPLAV